MKLFILSLTMLALTGCAGVDQLKKTLHDSIDIGFSVYDDGKDIYDAAKKLVVPVSPAEPTK